MELALRINVIVRGSIINTKRSISGSAGPIFAIFTPNESVLSADDRSLTSFCCHGNQFCEKMAHSHFIRSGVQKGLG